MPLTPIFCSIATPYSRGSVRCGQDMRCWLATWVAQQQARVELTAAQIKFDDLGDGGTTHVPISQVVAHLPDDTNY